MLTLGQVRRQRDGDVRRDDMKRFMRACVSPLAFAPCLSAPRLFGRVGVIRTRCPSRRTERPRIWGPTSGLFGIVGATNIPWLLALTGVVLGMPVSNAAATAPPWGIACGDGRVDAVLDNFDAPWDFCCTAADPSIPRPTVHVVPGCNGSAIAVDYDLTNVAPPGSANQGQSWIVLQRTLAPHTDLTNYTHVRLAMRGSNLNSHDSIEVKIRDTHGLFVAYLKSMTDLPVWRAIYIDLREFTGNGTIDLANIVGLEIGIVRCADCEVVNSPAVKEPPEQHFGTLYLDEFAVVNLKPGAVNRLTETGFETVQPNPTVRTNAAEALRMRIAPSGVGKGLVPAWFPETPPNFNTYAQAETLLVFVYEYERTGDIVFRDAARNIAAQLLSLQIPPGRAQAGAWFSSYDAVLSPPNRAIPNDPPTKCDGNEAMVPDPGQPGSVTLVPANIDACEWVGNVGWVMIALSRLQRSGFYDNSAALGQALDRGAAWVGGQSQYRGMPYPNLISVGTEGNISAYFGLLAASKASQAAQLGNAIFQFAWDPLLHRLKPGVGAADFATAMDVDGSWGVTFLRSIGRQQEASDSQSYAASVLRVSSFDGSIFGYGDIAGPYTPAIEFTAQAASAGIKDAAFVMQQIYSLQIPSDGTYPGAFPGAANHWYGGPFSPWNTTMAGASPTAWVYFALNRDPLIDVSLPVLGISKSHTGSFTQGQQNATYTVTVSNAARSAPTKGTVTVTETVPSGLTLASMSGTMWNCSANTCTRNDALAAGASYPAITVLVNVAASATSPQINSVSAAGGGSPNASATDITTIQSSGPLVSGVFNAATFGAGGIAPNEFISIKGSGLGPATGAVSAMTTLLAGTRIYIGGTPVPLIYAQYGQVNALVPWGIARAGTTTVQAETNGVKGNVVTLPVVDTAPGIFTQEYGPGQAWMINQDGTLNSASNPALRGTVVAFWATGQGLVDVAQQDGVQPTGPPFPRPLLLNGVNIGGIQILPAALLFDALVYSGEIQVNFLIPDNAPTGDSVPLVLMAGGVPSRTGVTMAIR